MKLRHQFERLAFLLVLFAVRILSRTQVLALGRAFGSLAYLLDRRHRIVALENYHAAFPDASEKEVRKTIRSCYCFFSSYLFDMLTCFSGYSYKTFETYEYEGMEHLEAAYRRGKGTIFFGGHMGAWEIMALAQGARGFQLGLVVRRLDNPHLELLLEKVRTLTGNFSIEKKEGFRPMLKALREGRGLAVLMDQNVRTEDRVFVEFFGRSASTTPSVALLKLKTDCSLIPVSGHWLSGNRYRFTYGAPVDVPLSGDRQEDVLRLTQECTRLIEQRIRQHPECWLWMHRRWKTQPEKPETK